MGDKWTSALKSTAADSPYDVAERGGHVEVRGASRHEVEAALDLFDKIRAVQADQVAATRGDLVRVLMARNVALTPPATLAQAQRLAEHSDALLATPVLTHDTLRALRGDTKPSSTRTWLTRRRENHELFTVAHNGRTLIPAFELDDAAHPRPELQPVLEALAAGGVSGWSLWTWLTTMNGDDRADIAARFVGASLEAKIAPNVERLCRQFAPDAIAFASHLRCWGLMSLGQRARGTVFA